MNTASPKFTPAQQPIHVRLSALEKHATIAGRRLTIMVNVSAVLLLAGVCWLGALLAQAIAGGAFSSSQVQSHASSIATILVVEAVLVGAMLVYLVVCAVLALLNSHELFAKYRAQTRLELHAGELGLVVADEGMWKQLIERLQRSFVFRLGGKKHYQGLERHLLFCAIHWNSLEKIARGTVKYSNFRLRQGQQDFNSLNMFYKPTVSKILGMVLVAILFFFHGLLVYPVILVTHGSRYIINYARLAALAEFYLGE